MRRPRTSFHRRHYGSLRELGADLQWLARNRGAAGATCISPAFRERLMLAVTSVNRCRYCAAFHDGAARLAGVSAEEAELLLHGGVGQAPAGEIPALLYALHWAQRDAQPDPALAEELTRHYGAETAAAITFALRAIRVGNLLGNSWDALLHALSGGRLGGGHAAVERSITSRPNLHRFSILGDYTHGVSTSRRDQQRTGGAGPEEETDAYS